MATKVQELTFAPRFKTAHKAGMHYMAQFIGLEVEIRAILPEYLPEHANAIVAIGGVPCMLIQIDEIEKR